MNPECLLTPTLSSFWGGEGEEISGVALVLEANARNRLQGFSPP